MIALSIIALALAAGPAISFWRNLSALDRAPAANGAARNVSILIPARDEALNIHAAVVAALANDGAEVIVLDDNSSDETARLVEELASPRLKLVAGKPLPPGWCGKNFACAQLAAAATRELLLFVDADVRLAPDAAARMSAEATRRRAKMISGVPRQLTGTFSERLLVPLVHFVLFAFLPLRRMRGSRHPAFATSCGQLVMVDAAAYHAAGGHSAIRNFIHEGLMLPKKFRARGFHTDLFDATDLATCRMYRNDRDVWRGFGKNAHEGLGAPALILPATLVLCGGQVLPFLLLAFAQTPFQSAVSVSALLFALLPRFLAAGKFDQRVTDIWLHPFAVIALLVIQWRGLARYVRRQPATWKNRRYASSAAGA
ncbi:MAG: glycosyltransferase [Verrucomicrobiota bacterium]|nr:glycosyltransferase [Verrucomicrobiota bacterium]